MTDRYRRATMSTLRVTFLSSLILELLATMSVALVAVAVGLRLLGGHMDFRTALFVLVLAPEAYLPLRLLWTNYHASTEGMEAAAQVFEVLDSPVPPRGSLTNVPDPRRSALSVVELVVRYPGRSTAALDGLSFSVAPGETVAVVGASGCGKSTLLSVLLGFVTPSSGSTSVADLGLEELDPDEWRKQVAWLPQHPHLFATTMARNIRLGRPDATDAALSQAASDAGLDEVVARMPHGLATELGENGAGLSAGERQRVALARVFLRDAPMLLLDEPTANLDGRTEEQVVDAIRRHVLGRTCIVVAHRPALLGLADRVVDLTAAGARP
jgi:ABC-type transport system involved in cytochrome bd biosynthesis fused ATPase/permease subunit